jgi:hypothetical protein
LEITFQAYYNKNGIRGEIVGHKFPQAMVLRDNICYPTLLYQAKSGGRRRRVGRGKHDWFEKAEQVCNLKYSYYFTQ